MPRKYDINFKSMIVNLIVNKKYFTIKTAQQFDIPLKTLKKWVTTFNKYSSVLILIIKFNLKSLKII